MKRIAWLTDIHLNFLAPEVYRAMMEGIVDGNPDAVIITGDIGEADSVAGFLRSMEEWLQRPIYFVLGNHDFYRGAIAGVRREIAALCADSVNLRWLNTAGVVELGPTTGLVGHDSWCDGRYGDYEGSSLVLSDFLFIEELLGVGKAGRRGVLAALADQAAAHFRAVLPEALERYHHVILATHVPPFEEACRHDGRATTADALPYYAAKSVGDVLRDAMTARPDRKLTVLCGHTHCGMNVTVLDNLRVVVGEVEYGKARVQQMLEIRPPLAAPPAGA